MLVMFIAFFYLIIYFNDMHVINIHIVITFGYLSCMELHYSSTDYPYGFPIFIYICWFIVRH